MSDERSARAQELIAEARDEFRRGRNDRTASLAAEALALARSAQDDRLVVASVTWLSRVALREGDYAQVRRLAEDALQVARRMGEPAVTFGPLHLLTAAARMEGDFGGARNGYKETLEIARAAGNATQVIGEIINIAAVDLLAGEAPAAGRGAREALRMAWDRENPMLISVCLSILGGVAVADGDAERGALLLAAAEASLRTSGLVFDPDDGTEHATRVALAELKLGRERYREIAAQGGPCRLARWSCSPPVRVRPSGCRATTPQWALVLL